MRRLIAVLLAILVSLISLQGCGNGGLKVYDFTATLWGFPYGHETFRLEVYEFGEDDVLTTYEFDTVFSHRPFVQGFDVHDTTELFAFYLFENSWSSEPGGHMASVVGPKSLMIRLLASRV